jgi:predicted small integral membrane protein
MGVRSGLTPLQTGVPGAIGMTRLAKSVMCLCLATFALLVAVDNIIDYGTNYAFVQHVLSMDTVFPDTALRWRAVTSPMLWRIGYASIIAGEAAAGLCFLVGGAVMLASLGAPERFIAAKSWVVAASTIAFLVWFLGFMVGGGEWFQMWQSQTWNGQQPAFRFYVTALLVLIFVQQPEPDAGKVPDRRW